MIIIDEAMEYEPTPEEIPEEAIKAATDAIGEYDDYPELAARTALKAAAPFLMAQALSDTAEVEETLAELEREAARIERRSQFHAAVSLGIQHAVDTIRRQKPVLTDALHGKPHRITTVEELDALPMDTVIRDADEYVWERWSLFAKTTDWRCAGAPDLEGDEVALPAVVIWEPEA